MVIEWRFCFVSKLKTSHGSPGLTLKLKLALRLVAVFIRLVRATTFDVGIAVVVVVGAVVVVVAFAVAIRDDLFATNFFVVDLGLAIGFASGCCCCCCCCGGGGGGGDGLVDERAVAWLLVNKHAPGGNRSIKTGLGLLTRLLTSSAAISS